MVRIFHPLLFLLARSTPDDLQKQNEFLKAELEILRKHVPKKYIILEPAEREKLLKLGKELGPAIRHLITIVSYSTFRRWVRKEEGRTEPSRKGRPRLAAIIRELVVMIAKETGWGYTRILGELRNLRVGPICRQSIKNILIEHGFDPGPKRGKGTWSDFLRIHAETLWQCDFFSKRIWTLKGPRQIFALAFIHLATRRVFVTPGTFKPDAVWMEEQALAFLDHAAEEKLPCSIVTCDYDDKFSKPFVQVFKDRSIRIKRVGPRAPNLQAFIERWIQSLKHEALDHFIVMGEKHFDFIVSEYVAFYHDHRPHQGIGNVLLPLPRGEPPEEADDDSLRPPLKLTDIKCERRLGGVLKHFYRDAA
ncbi:MAG TPA: integrase core domain-containing protein [Lacipirellulaceae bacterium]|nr:integrase core domain-containing protein [Lacipirellulaceae bacterium]